MKHAFVLVALCALAVTQAVAAELTRKDFAYAIPLLIDTKDAVYKVPLPLAVYQNTVRADLADIRVFNGQGEVVPYALRRPAVDVAAKTEFIVLPLFPLRGDAGRATDAIKLTIRTEGASIDVQDAGKDTGARVVGYLLDARVTAQPIGALELQWPAESADFSGRISVEASDDLGQWKRITIDAPIVNLQYGGQRLIQRRIEFPAVKAKYWRITWPPLQPALNLTTVTAEPAPGRVDIARATLTVAAIAVPDKPGEYEFDVGAHLPVDRINLELPEINTVAGVQFLSRPDAKSKWRAVTGSTLYRLQAHGQELANGALSLVPNTDRYWLVRVDQKGGGLGKSAPRLELGWLAHQLLFVVRGDAPFELAYGSGAAGPATVSLDSLLPADEQPSGKIVPINIRTATLASPVQVGGAARLTPVSPISWKAWGLWVVLIFAVAVLAWMAWRLTRQMQPSAPGAETGQDKPS
jgi:hypothetical protein